jgi:hypothetical protein
MNTNKEKKITGLLDMQNTMKMNGQKSNTKVPVNIQAKMNRNAKMNIKMT